ncbi:AraC family transcriptional regulator [Lachnoclostridium pacaense]|uniref:AraC family transcriptional regulator n=1 Tax=Enterocloster hominis (ex Hitch et al. 2024) TaxID=1917870 RepID=UPI001D11600C|nr:AraC family transcriptional regulator [Lachnoclostridium pacaense]MCC2818583.1 AraC family transcriptional regulator [Lachnoclostridium pacaense]
MSNIIKMQDLYFSDYDSHKLCQFYYEVLDKPTTPIIHQMSRFWLINKGKGVLKLQGKEYELKPGTLVSVLPWQVSDIVQVDSPIQYFLLVYYFDGVNDIIKSLYNLGHGPLDLIEDLSKNPVIYCSAAQAKYMHQLFLQLRDELGGGAVPSLETSVSSGFGSLFITNKLIELIINLWRIGKANSSQAAEISTPMDRTEILQYMYHHLSEKLTLKTLAKTFYMSESSVSLYIVQTTGLTFPNLLNEMRVGKTITYLLYTDFTMDELAEILGFVDSSHICKVFAARIGLKANEFRKTYQKIGSICNIRDSRKAYSIVEYIYKNYSGNLTPQSVARKFDITVRKLNTILFYQVEKSFSDFLNYVRINRACELLLDTDKTIAEIASLTGYNNVKTLTRNFLKFQVMTPGKFRESVSKNSGDASAPVGGGRGMSRP